MGFEIWHVCIRWNHFWNIWCVCMRDSPILIKRFPNCKQHMRNAMGSHFILSFSLFTEWNSVFHFAPSIIYQFQEMQFILIHWNKNVLPVKNWVMENGDDKKYVTIFNSSLGFCHTLNSHCSHCVLLTKTNKTRRSIVRLYLSYEQFELSYKLDFQVVWMRIQMLNCESQKYETIYVVIQTAQKYVKTSYCVRCTSV